MIEFLRVKDNQQKVQMIYDTILECYLKNKRILIKVASPQVARYVDQLLWRFPPDSFLPHTISDSKTSSRVAITTKSANVNDAHYLLNLSPEVFSETGSYTTIFELYDETDPDKQRLSETKHNLYKQRKLL